MLFNSLQFLAFFWMVVGIHWALPHRFRWTMLVAASCYFYMALVPAYILILFVVILVDWAAGMLLEALHGRWKLAALWTSLAANLGILAVFKYWGFLFDLSKEFASFAGVSSPLPMLHLILPIGLSFHTFQSMSYTIEVYRGAQKAERHLGIYALYVLFFPQMVAGPIERPQNVLHQLREVRPFDSARFSSGIRLVLWGLFKKSVLADNLASIVDASWSDPGAAGPWMALSALAFSFQILCDFWGYSDMARGAARCLGIDLMRNFDRPYSARSLGEFWRRWHVSLSTWFRDYLYIPLGGNRVMPWRRDFNLLVVFSLSGFWHGADWAFVVWGALHGIGLVVENRIARVAGGRQPSLWRGLLTFLVVTLAWVFFRASNLSEAGRWLDSLVRLDQPWMPPLGWWHVLLPLGLGGAAWIEKQREQGLTERWTRFAPAVRFLAIALFCLVILCFGSFDARNFIYFQF